MKKMYNVSNTFENGSRMDRVKSRIDSIQPAYTLLALLMVVLFGVNENAWGAVNRSWNAGVAVSQGKGTVTVTIYKHDWWSPDDESKRTIGSNAQKSANSSSVLTATDSESRGLESSISYRSCVYTVDGAATGYSWLGWYDGSGNLKTTDQTYKPWTKTKANKNESYYAKFSKNSYDVTLAPNGGSGNNQTIRATFDDAMPSTLKAGGAIVAPTMTGYTFAGYFDATSGGTKYYNADLSSAHNWDKASSDVTLYAQWTPNNYTITLTAGAGTTSAGTTSLTATFDANTNLTSAITTPTKSGNVFDGYYTGANGTGAQIIDAFGNVIAQAGGDNTYTDASKNWKYANNIELFANWIAKYDFEITGSNYKIDNESWTQATAFNFVHADEANMTTTIEKTDVISYNRGTNTITALKIGTSKITFTQNTSSTVNNGTIEFTITVDSVANTLAVSNTEFTRYVEQDIANVRSGKNSDGTITTTSSNPNLAYYDIEDNTIYIPNTDAQTLPFSDVIITISQAATAKYKYKKHTITLTVQKYENTLTCSWGSWSKNVNFDEENGVTFSSNNDTGTPIVVTPGAGVAEGNGTYDAVNHKVVAGHNVGSASWTISQAEDYKYQAAVSKTLTVNVGTASSVCYILENQSDEQHNSLGGTTHEHTWDEENVAGVVKFDVAHGTSSVGYYVEVQELLGSTWTTVSNSRSDDFTTEYTQNKRVTLSPAAKGVRFFCSGTMSGIWIKNVSVTRNNRIALEDEEGSAISEIDMPVNTIGGNVTRNTFYIDYSTCASKIKLVSNNSRIKFAANNSTTYEFDENNGTRKAIELTYTSPADAEEIEATITVYTPYEHETLTVNAETMGKLPTTIEYIGADSYNVDHADMNATDLFQVRDENGDLVASPAITLSSSNTSKINTVSSNTAIDFLCGADDVRITAFYAGDETYAAASNSGTFYHDIDVIKLADAITWTIGSDAENKIHVWADSDVPNTIASSDNTSIATYSSNNSDRLSISGSAGSYSLHAGQKGEVTLTATSAGDCTYNVAKESKTIVVDPCRHDIVWNQNFKSLMTEEDGTIDQTIDLTAYAVDSNEVATNKSITYTLASTAFASIVDGTKLRITGTGQTTITATTADDNKYATTSASLQIRVRTYGAGCGSEVADPNQHNVSGYTNKNGLTYAIPPSDKIYVKVGRQSRITCDSLQIIGYDENGVGTLIKRYNPSELTNDGADKEIPIEEKYRKIKFIARGETGIDPGPNGGTQYKWFSNLRITQKSYLRSNRANITNDRVHVYDAINETVVVSYSDKPLLNYRITGSHLTLTPSETVDNDCGDFGSYTFTVRGSYTTSGRFRDTIYITTTALDTLRIPIDFTVSPGTELYFQTSSGSWNTETKWTNETGVVQDQVPAHDNRVIIREAVTIDCQAEAYKVTIGEGGSVTIVPGGGLSVGAGGIDGATPSNLIIQAGTEGATKGQTGYLRIAPEYAATMPQATVQFYSTVHYNTALSGDNAATYQCVGAPVEGVLAKTVFTPGSYLYTWDEEQDGWVSSRTKLTFEAFKGFEVTQKKAAAGLGFEYAGQLISVSEVKTIDLDYSDAVKGYNLLANSFTAPIDIAQFRAGDFINANQTIYILNAGTKANSDDPESDIDAPGKWIGMPIATVAELAASGYPRMIAPLQGFWIKATGASPQLTLDYSRLVWGVDYSGDRANKPLRAPKRDAEMDEEMPITGKLQVSLYSETERDFFFMLESERYDAAYENGYDAPKIPSGSMDVFTVEGENEFGVDATNSIIGTRVGVRTGDESVYTFVFSHLSGENEWALYDHETGDKTDINEGTEYMFFAEPYSLLNGRFEIVERADAPSITTGVDGADNEVKAYKFIKDNQLYILKNGVLYNVMGGVVR